MPSRITLTLPSAVGGGEVQVDTKRFSIGRIPGNDLVIDDSSLSRRHALIEDYDGAPYVSDCGSSNGTFVNGERVEAVTRLSDEDVLTFGAIDVVVHISAEQQPSANQASVASAPIQHLPHHSPPAVGGATGGPSWLNAPVIAGVAVVLIVLVAGLLLILANSNSPRPPVVKKRPVVENGNDVSDTPDNNNTVTIQPTPSATNGDSGNGTNTPESADLAAIESNAAKVLRGISKDTAPVISEKGLSEINARVQRYKGSSSVRDELRALKQSMSQVSAVAKSNGIRAPLVAYVTLAQIDKNHGDVVQVAGQMAPALARMRVIFGDELANDSLLSVAALEEGPGLQMKITKLAGRVSDSPTTIRSIWYLHDHQVISDQTYDLVVRFIALGVVAQDPQKFGITADPLTF